MEKSTKTTIMKKFIKFPLKISCSEKFRKLLPTYRLEFHFDKDFGYRLKVFLEVFLMVVAFLLLCKT